MNLQFFYLVLGYLIMAAAILILGHYGLGLLALLLALIPAGISWWTHGRSRVALTAVVPELFAGVNVVGLISLSRPPLGQPVLPPVTQITLALLYATWLLFLPRLRRASSGQIAIAGVNQFMLTTVVFLAAAFWHWPNIAVMVIMWAASYLNAWWYLEQTGERASRILAATWALIVAEVSWVLYIWQVNYIITADLALLIIPQAAVVILGLGYAIASVHAAHTQKRLSRRRLIEYVALAGVLLAIIIAGTRWNGIS